MLSQKSKTVVFCLKKRSDLTRNTNMYTVNSILEAFEIIWNKQNIYNNCGIVMPLFGNNLCDYIDNDTKLITSVFLSKSGLWNESLCCYIIVTGSYRWNVFQYTQVYYSSKNHGIWILKLRWYMLDRNISRTFSLSKCNRLYYFNQFNTFIKKAGPNKRF